MPKRDPTKRLTKLTLKLMARDLKRVESFKLTVTDKDGNVRQEDPPPGEFSLVLSRYFSALMAHKRTAEKLEGDEREALKKLSTKQLKELAGVKE